jgi:hypothetical protein
MNRLLLLVLVAGATFLIVLFAVKPELIENIWLWLVGLSGLIVKAFQSLLDFFQEKFSSSKEDSEKKESERTGQEKKTVNQAAEKKPFDGVSISLLRYSDDGDTTLGLLSINDQFYCYTLEDAFHEEKITGETRIPAGSYPVEFRKEETELTLKYRERYPEWFTYHLQLQNVPEFNAIYIHNGGDHTNTEGCILVSDSLNVNNEKTFLSNSRETFRRFYSYLSEILENNVPIKMTIYDENWIKNLN